VRDKKNLNHELVLFWETPHQLAFNRFQFQFQFSFFFQLLTNASHDLFNLFIAKKLPKNVNIHGVFAANELDLDEVNVYGFDYDYT
jgi:hypothetical protein